MRKCAIVSLALFCLPAMARAYDAAALQADASDFLSAESLIHRNLSASIATLRQSQPLLAPSGGLALSSDLSLGQIVAPAFDYRDRLGAASPFASLLDSGDAASIEPLSAGMAAAFRGGLGLNVNVSYLPPLLLNGGTKSLFRIGASGYWRLLSERFYSVGALIGAGASYVHGTESRSLATSFADSGNHSFSGSLDSQWNSGILDLELFLHKTFFIVNFYTRATGSLVFGSSSSTLSDIKVDGSPVADAQPSYSSVLQAPAASLVLSGGMELILGELKVSAEAGRDWLSGTFYGSVGLRFGM